MPVVNLDPSEFLVRVFARDWADTHLFTELVVTDFERKPKIHESGISFWRMNKATFRHILFETRDFAHPKRGRKPRGIAIAAAEFFLMQGYSFVGNGPNAQHVELNCFGCDFAPRDCLRHPENDCPLAPEMDDRQRATLARKTGAMTIVFPALPYEFLMDTFARDVDERDVLAANGTYYQRFLSSLSAPPEAIQYQVSEMEWPPSGNI